MFRFYQSSLSCQVVKLTFEDGIAVLHLASGEQVTAKCVLIATGVEYLKLNVEGRDRFDGAGIYYAATTTEAQMCSGSQVAVVGGANSAGQAAVFLAEHVEKVWLLIRGDDLSKSMSRYLICRIEQMENIELLISNPLVSELFLLPLSGAPLASLRFFYHSDATGFDMRG